MKLENATATLFWTAIVLGQGILAAVVSYYIA